MQSNKNSLYESIVQSIAGVSLGFMIQKFVLPHIGIEFTNEQNAKAVIIFFVASLCRQYIIRRIFNLNFRYIMKFYLRIFKEYYAGTILFILYIFSFINKKKIKKLNYSFLKDTILRTKREVKTKYYRRIITMVLKRHKISYKKEDFEKAKKLFEEFKTKNGIQSIFQVNIGDYLFIINTDYPVKGENFCSYYIYSHQFDENNRVFQIKDVDIHTDSVSGGETEIYRNVKQCRFATPEEIKIKLDNDLEKELLKAIGELHPRSFFNYYKNYFL